MRRLILCIAISLSLISLSSAQQKNNAPSGTCPAGLCFIQNTNGLQYTQHGASFNIDGSGAVGGGLSASTVSAATQYGIGGYNALFTGPFSDANLFVGPQAGMNNVGGQGVGNTFTGTQAGFSNTTGTFDTFYGFQAGAGNTTHSANTFIGYDAGYQTSTGGGNSFLGWATGYTANGYFDTYLGYQAGYFLSGDHNIAIGDNAGLNNNSGTGNIYIGSQAFGNESNTIRIGGTYLNGGPQTSAYIAGIYGASVGNQGIPVVVDNNGQLGTIVSSRRFKEQIKDMADSTNALMQLRPVTFVYKPEYAKGDRTLQYGLIAEEVAQVYPDLVAYDKDGQPFTVRYQYLASMLLNEFQKQHHREEEQAQVIESQKQEIEGLRQQLQLQSVSMQMRMSKLESLVERQTTIAEK